MNWNFLFFMNSALLGVGLAMDSLKIDGVSRREAMANDNMQIMKNILKI